MTSTFSFFPSALISHCISFILYLLVHQLSLFLSLCAKVKGMVTISSQVYILQVSYLGEMKKFLSSYKFKIFRKGILIGPLVLHTCSLTNQLWSNEHGYNE